MYSCHSRVFAIFASLIFRFVLFVCIRIFSIAYILKLLSKSQVAVIEKSNVRNAVLNHRKPIHAAAKSKAPHLP